MDAEYRDQTMSAYDDMAANLAPGYAAYFVAVAHAEATRFVADLPQSSMILDLGCGPGAASRFFADVGLRPICADLSREMLAICRGNGLRDLLRLDLEHLPFAHCSLSAVWAHTSLIHVPKGHLTQALCGIARVLTPKGRLFVAVRKGAGDGYAGDAGRERWFAEYAVGEFERYIPHSLTLVRYSITAMGRRRFLNYHLRRR